MGHLDDAIDEDPGSYDLLRRDGAEIDEATRLHDRQLRRHRHGRGEIARRHAIGAVSYTHLDVYKRQRQLRRHRHGRGEIARRHAIGEIAPAVGSLRLDQRDIALERLFEHVFTTIDRAGLLAFRELGAGRGGREETTDPRPRRAHALGERALRHELELDLAGGVELLEHHRAGGARIRADDLAHVPGRQQLGDIGAAGARIVGDDGELLGALRDQRIDQLDRNAGGAETADEHGCAIADAGDGGGQGGDAFVDHGERTIVDTMASDQRRRYSRSPAVTSTSQLSSRVSVRSSCRASALVCVTCGTMLGSPSPLPG